MFFIRHGQYELETDDHGLTELGKHQAKKTGERLKQMADGLKKDHYGEIKIKWKTVTSSGMLRARQTADIIAEVLGAEVNDYDGILNEGTPCIHHPGGVDVDSGSKLSRLLHDAPRLEAAFNKYIHRKTNLKKAE